MANQWTNNPSTTYGAYHIRLRKLRGKASRFDCFFCIVGQAAEWAQLHGCDGFDPYMHFVPACMPCHRHYDGTPTAVAESNRKRTGETRKQYVVRDKEEFSKQQAAKSKKCRPDCDCGRHPLRKSTVARKRREQGGDAK